MPKRLLVHLLPLLLLLLNVPVRTLSESLSCAFTRLDSIQLYQCGSELPRSSDTRPSPMLIELGLTELSVPNTAIVLSNAVVVRPEPSLLDLPVEIKRCGLADLSTRLGSINSGGLLLNFSSMLLRFGGHGEFDGLSPLAPTWLDVSRNHIDTVPSGVFDALPKLVALDLSWNRIEHLDNDTFCSLAGTLRWLDLRGNPMLATYSLPVLHSLEWLDTSLSKILTGFFCRMPSLRRVTLHRALEQLNCFVFDSLPNLTDLSLTYQTGAKNICLTMTCDPHPVLGNPVPFNFSITTVYSNGSISANRKNLRFKQYGSLYGVYNFVCIKNYKEYLTYHDEGIPATRGCLRMEAESPSCPNSSPSFVCSAPSTQRTSTTTTPAPAITSKTATTTTTAAAAAATSTAKPSLSNASSSSTALGIKKTEISTIQPTTSVMDNFYVNLETTAQLGASDSSDTDNLTDSHASNWNTTAAKKILDVLRKQRIRSLELEKEIKQLERVIIVVYSISAALLFILLVLVAQIVSAKCCHRRRRRGNFWREHGRDLMGPEQHPLHQTDAASAEASAAVALNCENQHTPAVDSDPSNEYVPMRNPVYPKLPGVFPNPIYGRASKA